MAPVRLSAGDLELLVGGLLFLERLLEQCHRLGETEFIGPGDERAIAGDLVVLNRIARRNQACVDRGRFREFLDDFLTFGDNSLDCLAGLALSALADDLEDLLQTLDLAFGLLLVFQETLSELLGLGGTLVVSGGSVEQFYKTNNWYDRVVTCATYPCENLHDRPPLLLRATFNGPNGPYAFAVLNNHTKSIGNVDATGTPAERDRAKRFQQAHDVATLVQQFQTSTGPFNGLGTAGIPLVLVGDYNAFEYTDGHADVVGLIAGTYNDAANECAALLSDGQGTETCNIGTNIVTPTLFNSGLAVPEAERMSYKFTQNFGVVQGSDQRDVASVQVIDHILLARSAQGFYLGTDYGISNNAAAEQTNRQLPLPTGPVTPIRASDHDGLVAYLDFNCLANPDLNADGDTVCGMLDNCPVNANSDQADMDADGQGDACDNDIDGGQSPQQVADRMGTILTKTSRRSPRFSRPRALNLSCLLSSMKHSPERATNAQPHTLRRRSPER